MARAPSHTAVRYGIAITGIVTKLQLYALRFSAGKRLTVVLCILGSLLFLALFFPNETQVAFQSSSPHVGREMVVIGWVLIMPKVAPSEDRNDTSHARNDGGPYYCHHER